jgi:Leucine-rich repeat (LRR) protein
MLHESSKTIPHNPFTVLSDRTNTWQPTLYQYPVVIEAAKVKELDIFSLLRNREIGELLPFFSVSPLKNGANNPFQIERKIRGIERHILNYLPKSLCQNNCAFLKDRFLDLLRTAYDYSLVQIISSVPNFTTLKETHGRAPLSCQWPKKFPHKIKKVEIDEPQELLCLPKKLFQFSLTTLSVCHSHLTALPSQIGNLTSLKKLSLSDNCLINLPPEISKLMALTSLDVSKNRFQSLPKELGALPNLRTLIAGSNSLESFSTAHEEFKNLQRLDLSDNRLSILPNNICLLTSLQELNLFLNKIRVLPWNIGDLHSLTALDLNANNFALLPITIYGLHNLKRLDLGNNPITQIPKAIIYLQNLEQLGLAHTPSLRALPQQIALLSKLRRIELGNDQPKVMPPEVQRMLENMKKRLSPWIQKELKKKMLEEKKMGEATLPVFSRRLRR